MVKRTGETKNSVDGYQQRLDKTELQREHQSSTRSGMRCMAADLLIADGTVVYSYLQAYGWEAAV